MTLQPDGTIRFAWPDGEAMPEAPPPPPWHGPALAPIERTLAAGGSRINQDTTPDWHGEPLDLDWALLVLRQPSSVAERGACRADPMSSD